MKLGQSDSSPIFSRNNPDQFRSGTSGPRECSFLKTYNFSCVVSVESHRHAKPGNLTDV